MTGSTAATIVMIVMMGGMVVGTGWALLRRRRNRDREANRGG
jgi:LPXTG-motif cell wall-anchored protein